MTQHPYEQIVQFCYKDAVGLAEEHWGLDLQLSSVILDEDGGLNATISGPATQPVLSIGRRLISLLHILNRSLHHISKDWWTKEI